MMCLISEAIRHRALLQWSPEISSGGHKEAVMLLVYDLLIALAYFAIPLEMLYFFLRFPFPIRAKPALVGCIFVCFITLCGGTHVFRAFDLQSAVPFITGACMVISVAAAAALLWLIPGMFMLARELERDRAEKEMLDDLTGSLTEAVELSDNSRGSAETMMKAVRLCTRRQLQMLTAARSSLKRAFGMKSVDIKCVDGLGPVPATIVALPINDVFVVLVDATVHQQQQELLERAALQIAQCFRDAGDIPLES